MPPPGRTPRCASSPSIPTRACRSGAWRSRRGSHERARPPTAAARPPVRRLPAAARVASPQPAVEPATSRGPRRLAKPKPVRVKATDTGRPQKIGNREVDAVRESWLVEDRWWTDAPLRRRYWEVVTADGRDLVVFRDLLEGRWYAQR